MEHEACSDMVDGPATFRAGEALAGACAGGVRAAKPGSLQDRGSKRRRPDGRERDDEGVKLRRQTGGGILRYFRRVDGQRPSQLRLGDRKRRAGSPDALLAAALADAPEAPLAAVSTAPPGSATCPATAVEPPESSLAADGENSVVPLGARADPSREEPATEEDELPGPTQMWGRIPEAPSAVCTQAESHQADGVTPLDEATNALDATLPLTHSPMLATVPLSHSPESAPVLEPAETATHEPCDAVVCDSQGFPGPTQMWGMPDERQAALAQPPCQSPAPRRVPPADFLEPISPTLTFHPQEPRWDLTGPPPWDLAAPPPWNLTAAV